MSSTRSDDVCKSCGRTFEEVACWIVMTPDEKARTWARLNKDGWWNAQRRSKSEGATESMTEKTFMASPACNRKGVFLFDQIDFEYDPVQ